MGCGPMSQLGWSIADIERRDRMAVSTAKYQRHREPRQLAAAKRLPHIAIMTDIDLSIINARIAERSYLERE